MYPWDLGELGFTPLLGPELPSVHQTRLELIEEPVRAALEEAGEGACAIDLACSEGWFAHRLLDWGADRVLGVDLRKQNVRRANLVRDHLGVSAERLQFIESDVFDLDLDALGRFDVVLVLGLIYHLEDPAGALRRAQRLTRRLCVIETQLTRQTEPITHGMGATGYFDHAAASFAAIIDQNAANDPLASAEGIMSLVPNRAAAEMLVGVAGFGPLAWREPAEHHNEQYRVGDRGVLTASAPREHATGWLTYPWVRGRIHPNDDILDAHDTLGYHYSSSGRSALRCIEAALGLVDRRLDEAESILDMACGYGRVLRLLAEQVPPERITACDVVAEAVAFCVHEFGARALLSDPEFEGVPFETYDLIWVGSLITHLDEPLFTKFTELLPGLLRPGGVVLLTTLGDSEITDVSIYEPRLGAMQAELEGEYRRSGFAFVPYEGLTDGLGYAWHSPDFLTERVVASSTGRLERLAAWPRAWANRQDVLTFHRAG